MRARAQHLDLHAAAYGAHRAGGLAVDSRLWPGERAGPPLASPLRKAVRRGVVALIVVGSGWAALDDRVPRPDWASVAAAVSAWMAPNAQPQAGPHAPAMATALPPAGAEAPSTPVPREPAPPVAAAPSAGKLGPAGEETAKPPPTPGASAALPDAGAGAEAAAAAPLPPPISDPADPYRRRAEAVGLHPDLSRVLLDRLSPADYRHAVYAVETALATTPDTAAFVWPRQRKPQDALFRVHFVQGAAPSCRRYVVSITKDGWLTTALPMERCAAPPGRSARRD